MPSQRRTSKDAGHEHRLQVAPYNKAARSKSCRTATGPSLVEAPSRGCHSLSSSPLSSPPSSPASSQNSSSTLSSTSGTTKPTRRTRATDRERSRMHKLNDAYDALRTKVPTYPCSEKPSKIQTLRLAIEYIADLRELLDSTEELDVFSDDIASAEGGQSSEHCGSSVSEQSETPKAGDEDEVGEDQQPPTRTPSRSSGCSASSSPDARLRHQLSFPSIITTFITQTTGCSSGRTSPAGPQPLQSQPSPSLHLDHAVHPPEQPQPQSEFPQPQAPTPAQDSSIPLSTPLLPVSLPTVVSPLHYRTPYPAASSDAHTLLQQTTTRFEPFLHASSQSDVWSSALAEEALSIPPEPTLTSSLSDAQVSQILSELTMDPSEVILSPTTKAERSLFDSLLLQSPNLPGVTMGSCASFMASLS